MITTDASVAATGHAHRSPCDTRIRASLESLLDGFSILSALRNGKGAVIDFSFAYINTAGCHLNGKSREDHLGHTLLELFPQLRETGLIEAYAKIIETGEPLHRHSVIDRDGPEGGQRLRYAFDLQAVKIDEEIAVTWRDVTAQMLAQEALRESEETARALLNATTDAAFLIDTHGVILAANETMAELMGCPLPEVNGRTIRDFTPRELLAPRWEHIEQVISTGSYIRFEDQACGRWWCMTLYPIHDDLGLVKHLAVYCREITEQKQMEERLHHLAFYDHLTGLPNRFMLHDRLCQMLSRQKRLHAGLALLFLDLDYFKEINDTFGHPIGDQVLQEVAQRLKQAVRECDTVARMGGDEFVVVLTDLRQAHEDAEATAQRIQQLLACPLVLHGHQISVVTSIGITLAPADGATPETLLKHADIAMYRAKDNGRNAYRFYSEVHPAPPFSERVKLEAALRGAMEHGELQVYFQPQQHAVAGHVVGVEALLRWRHPEIGMIPPMQFLPAVEESGVVAEIGAWVMETACRQVAAWHAAGAPALRLAVNVSPAQLTHPAFLDMITQALRSHQLLADTLEIEIPEYLVVHDPSRLQVIMEQLHALGVRIAVDDVGLGHSTIDYLRRYPISALKIDGSFIRHVAEDNENATSVRTVIEISHHCGLTTVAECVETAAQLNMLRAHGCDLYQGYLFAKPLPAQECERLLLLAP